MTKTEKIQFCLRAAAAGLAISIGGIAFLATKNAWLFAIGLFIVCFFGLELVTGKAPYINFGSLFDTGRIWSMWAVNTISAYGIGWLIHWAKPNLSLIALDIATTKLEQSSISLLIFSSLCGIMIYIAVEAWKHLVSPNNIVGMIFATAIFVFCGFEHCIANAFYFGAAGLYMPYCFLFLFINATINIISGALAHNIIKFAKEV